jgi:hypothetical protein
MNVNQALRYGYSRSTLKAVIVMTNREWLAKMTNEARHRRFAGGGIADVQSAKGRA